MFQTAIHHAATLKHILFSLLAISLAASLIISLAVISQHSQDETFPIRILPN